MVPIAGSDNRINLAAGVNAMTAFANPVSPWGVMNVPQASIYGLYQLSWTSDSTLAVTANTPYTISLFGRHELGNTNSDCLGSLSVLVF